MNVTVLMWPSSRWRLSPDWDLVAYSAIGSGGGDISGGGEAGAQALSKVYRSPVNLGVSLTRAEIENTITDPLPLAPETSFWIRDNASRWLVVWDGSYYHWERLTRV